MDLTFSLQHGITSQITALVIMDFSLKKHILTFDDFLKINH
tara:strand:+ start:75 stop:197 length:123 start_codon:yes stop_codon:yes gene_type:complete